MGHHLAIWYKPREGRVEQWQSTTVGYVITVAEDLEEGVYKPVFPILGVFRLKGQPKRDSGIIVRSCKASQSSVYPIRDAILAVNHVSCPSLSSSGPPPMG